MTILLYSNHFYLIISRHLEFNFKTQMISNLFISLFLQQFLINLRLLIFHFKFVFFNLKFNLGNFIFNY